MLFIACMWNPSSEKKNHIYFERILKKIVFCMLKMVTVDIILTVDMTRKSDSVCMYFWDMKAVEYYVSEMPYRNSNDA